MNELTKQPHEFDNKGDGWCRVVGCYEPIDADIHQPQTGYAKATEDSIARAQAMQCVNHCIHDLTYVLGGTCRHTGRHGMCGHRCVLPAPTQSQPPQIEAIRKAFNECPVTEFTEGNVSGVMILKSDWKTLVDAIQSKQESPKI